MRPHHLIAVAGLFIEHHALAQSTAVLDNLELYWSYNRSPPVYPSPNATGTGDWAAAYEQAQALVAKMNNTEKENITIGYGSSTNGCSGNSGSVPRLNFSGLCLNDAGNGPRAMDGVNAYPAGLHVAATWNRSLAYDRGQYMGAEFKAKGVHVALGPVVGPLGRVAEGGRNWEGFSPDPYLTGDLAAQTVLGMQQSVITSLKHFIVYEQETNRMPSGSNASYSANLDDQTMHELYLWPFQDAIRAGTGCVMCSYNRVNNSYGCQNSKTQNGLLKGELGFQGFVVSDWSAQHAGIASADAGMDMVMPDFGLWQGHLANGVANKSLSQARLDDMATRIVATWIKFANFSNPGFGVTQNTIAPHRYVNARDPASKSTIFQGAVEGHVLVKNVNKTLPLKSPKLLSLFGYDAYAPLQNNPNSAKWTFGYESVGVIANDLDVGLQFGAVNSTGHPEATYNGTLICGGGSGANSPAYISSPFEAFQQQAYQDNTQLLWDFYSNSPNVDLASDGCIVFINEFAAEGVDRPGLADAGSDTLVINVANQCNNTIVVIHNAGIRLVDNWIEHPNITAVIFAHLPGQDSGRALVEVMYGNQSPSGRLPYTVAKQASDYWSLQSPVLPSGDSEYYTQLNFTESTLIDYRHFLSAAITPRFEFGFGLTYTTFNYTSLAVSLLPNSTALSATPPPAPSPMPQGGNPALFAPTASATFTLTNTGNFTASEVAQLYIGYPGGSVDGESQGEPLVQIGRQKVRWLRGYSKQNLAPGGSVKVEMMLTRRDLSRWDVVQQEWVLRSGRYDVFVGASVLDNRLVGNLTVLQS